MQSQCKESRLILQGRRLLARWEHSEVVRPLLIGAAFWVWLWMVYVLVLA